MKTLTFILAVLTSFNAFADVGTVSCTNTARSIRNTPLQVVASGKIESTTNATNGEITFNTNFDSIQLYSEKGAVTGSVVNALSVSTLGEYMGDYLDLDYSIADQTNLFKSIHLDLSSANRGTSLFITKRGNTYRSNCSVEWADNN